MAGGPLYSVPQEDFVSVAKQNHHHCASSNEWMVLLILEWLATGEAIPLHLFLCVAKTRRTVKPAAPLNNRQY